MSGYGDKEVRDPRQDKADAAAQKVLDGKFRDRIRAAAKPVEATADDKEWWAGVERKEAVERAQEAARIVHRGLLDDPDAEKDLWSSVPMHPGVWKSETVMQQQYDGTVKPEQVWRKEHPESTPVPSPWLEWVATGRQDIDQQAVRRMTAEPQSPHLHDQDAREAWVAAWDVADDYTGGPVAWDTDIPQQDQGGEEVSL